MADLKISDLSELTGPATGDWVEIVDVSDTSMAATGTNKKIKKSNLSPITSVAGKTGTVTLDANDVTAVTDKNYATDAEKTKLTNLSGTNTGDETQSSIKTKLGVASNGVDGYISGTDWGTFNSKQNALGFTPEDSANKDQALGYPSLDNAGKLPMAELTYHNHQAGLDDIPTITYGTGGDAGKFSVATADLWFFTDATRDAMALHTIADSGWLTPADDTTTYVCADRDTDTWVQITTISDIDYVRYVPYFITFKRTGSNNLHHQIIQLLAHGETENHHSRVLRCARYDRETGALESIAVDASLNITCSGGGVWAVNKRYEIPTVTTATRQFKCENTGTGWTITSNTSPVINNTQYNGASGYTTLTDTYWTINYLYRGIEEQDHIYTTLSTSQYATSALAQADNSVPPVPDLISSHAVFVGRVIVQKSATSSYIIESAFKTVFAASSSVSDHGSLTGLSDDDHPQYQKTSGMTGYISTGATSGYGTNVPLQTVTNNQSNYFLAGDGSWNTAGGGPGGGVAMQGSGTYVHTSGTVQFNNSNGVSFGLSTNGVMTASIGNYQTTGNYQTSGNYLSTNDAANYLKTTGFAGTNISGTLASTGMSLSVAAQTGNFLSTNADTAYAKNSLFAGTNISGTLNSTAFNLSVQESGNSTSFGYQSATPSQTTGYSSILGNNGAWNAINSIASTNNTFWGAQSATPSQTTGASSVLANNKGWVTVCSTTGNFISTGATSGYGSNIPLQTTTANASNSFLAADGRWTTVGGGGTQYATQSVSTGATSHVLYGDGGWRSVGGGTVNQTGPYIQAGTTTSNTFSNGTVAFNVSGGGLSVVYQSATATSNPQTIVISKEADIYNSGFVLQGNTAGSSSFGNTAEEKMSIYGGNNITVSGTNANVMTIQGAMGTGFSGTNISGTLNSAGLNISVAAPGGAENLSYKVYPEEAFRGVASTNSSMISTNVMIRHIRPQENVQFTRVDWPISVSVGTTTNTSSRSVSLNCSVVLYTLNGSTLTPVTGTTLQNTTSYSTNSTGSIAGVRYFSWGLNSTLIQNSSYWLGFQYMTATGNGATASLYPGLCSLGFNPQAILPWGSSSRATSDAYLLTQGMIAASMSNTTNTWNTNQIDMGSASFLRANAIVAFKNISA